MTKTTNDRWQHTCLQRFTHQGDTHSLACSGYHESSDLIGTREYAPILDSAASGPLAHGLSEIDMSPLSSTT